eukprot:3160394-Rhodomonas_salina.1
MLPWNRCQRKPVTNPAKSRHKSEGNAPQIQRKSRHSSRRSVTEWTLRTSSMASPGIAGTVPVAVGALGGGGAEGAGGWGLVVHVDAQVSKRRYPGTI